MPIYEYRCDSCDHQFEYWATTTRDLPEKCPQCGSSEDLKKLLSDFSPMSADAGGSSSPCSDGSCSSGTCPFQ